MPLDSEFSPEMTAKMTEAANQIAWKNPDLNVLRPELSGQYPLLAQTLETHIKRSHARRKLVLPDLALLLTSAWGYSRITAAKAAGNT